MTIARPVAALRGQRNFRVAFAAQSGAVGTSGKPQATQPLIQRMFLQARLDLTEPADQEVYPTWIVLIQMRPLCRVFIGIALLRDRSFVTLRMGQPIGFSSQARTIYDKPLGLASRRCFTGMARCFYRARAQ